MDGWATAHLDTLGDDDPDLRLRQYQRASRRMRVGKPISVAEEDRLTTATKRALLAHNEA
jgi:hypothetical protein